MLKLFFIASKGATVYAAVFGGVMYAGIFILLWFLLAPWKSSATIPWNSTSSEDTKVPPRIDSMPIAEVHASSYVYGSHGGSTQVCGVPWSCCDRRYGDILHGIMKCLKQNVMSIQNGYCLTLDEDADTLEVGHCLYNYKTYHGLYNDLPQNKSKLKDYMCDKQVELHRTGTLCGKCQDGYYPLAYSFNMTCVQCPNGKSNWWKFVLAAFLPLTAFCIIILIFKINVVSSRFQSFLFYSQMISMPAIMRVLMFFKYNSNSEAAIIALTALYGIWNLDFLRSMNLGICLGTDTLQTLALDLIVGVYPLLLMVMSYVLIELYDRNFRPVAIMWKPFRRLFDLFQENWDLRTSVIDSFATTFLLANVKLQSVSFDLLIPVKVYHLYDTGNWTYSYRLFYDATIPYFGSRHLPYAIISVVVIMLFAILPVLLLVLYPFRCFQKFLNLFPIRWYILHTFVDLFYGSYKDGTQPGTRDCRWFASLFILTRFCMLLVGACLESLMYFHIGAMILAVVAILFIAVQPFKENASHQCFLCRTPRLVSHLFHRWYGKSIDEAVTDSTVLCLNDNISCPSSLVHICHRSTLDLQPTEVCDKCDSQVTCLEERL